METKDEKVADTKPADNKVRRDEPASEAPAAADGEGDLYVKQADGTFTPYQVPGGRYGAVYGPEHWAAAMHSIDVGTTQLGQALAGVRASGTGVVDRIAAVSDKVKTSMTLDEVAHVKNVIDLETQKVRTVLGNVSLIANALHKVATDPSAPMPPTPLLPSV